MRRVIGAMVLLTLTSAGSAVAAVTPSRDAQALAATLDAGTPLSAEFTYIAPPPDAQAECANGVDDDGDDLIDEGADPGCASASDNREQDDAKAQCANAEDDDGDGFVDFVAPLGQSMDAGCSSASDDNEVDGEENPVPACANGSDDDGDELIDLADAGCESLDDLDEGSEGLPLGADTNPAARGSGAGLGGFPTAGSEFLILSSGNSTFADDANESANTSQVNGDAAGSAAFGDQVHDLVQLKLGFTAPAEANCARLSFRFLSEEFPEFVGSSYNDGFVAELDGSGFTASTTSISAPRNFAFDSGGGVVSINTAGFSAAEAAGTTYDGATPVLRASTPITPGPHTIHLSVFDLSDSVLDSAVFVDHLRLVSVPDGTCVTGATSDESPPETTITDGPADVIDGPTATVSFSSSEPDGGSFQCRVDAQTFLACSSPFTTEALGQGRHAFEVRAVDAAGNIDPTPARREFTVGAASAPPATDLRAEIDDPSKAVKAGGEYTYTLRVRNTGAEPARGVELLADMPTGTAFTYTTGDASCSGVQDLRCEIGDLMPGSVASVGVRMATGQISSGGAGPGARSAAAPRRAKLTADVTVTSDTADTDPNNDIAVERTVIKTTPPDYVGRNPAKARASVARPTYGWHMSPGTNEAWGASSYRGFPTAQGSEYGLLQTDNVGWQRNVPVNLAYFWQKPDYAWLDMWQAIDYQLQQWRCTGYSLSCTSSKWVTVNTFGGFKKPSLNDGKVSMENSALGTNGFWRVQSNRGQQTTRHWDPPLVQWLLDTPGVAYKLRSRWTYWRDRIGPRDQVHQTGWVDMAVVRSGGL